MTRNLARDLSRVCHRCYANRNDFLPDVDVELAKVEKRLSAIEKQWRLRSTTE